jgi:hypothetical protein
MPVEPRIVVKTTTNRKTVIGTIIAMKPPQTPPPERGYVLL